MSSELTSRPLATFAVVTYNQAKFIREAVRSALAQTYSPLEILLSDDCSTDGTFEIMQQMASEYRGPHTIRLNRNEPNLGLAGHSRKVTELACGEWIVGCAGDDISLPERTERVMEIAVGDPSLACICSRISLIAEDGSNLCKSYSGLATVVEGILEPVQTGNVNETGLLFAKGASAAWKAKIVRPWLHQLMSPMHEDLFLSIVCYLEQTAFYEVPEELVLYRRHAENLSHVQSECVISDEKQLMISHEKSAASEAAIKYFLTGSDLGSTHYSQKNEILQWLNRRVIEHEMFARWWDLPSLERLRLVAVHRLSNTQTPPHIVKRLLRCLPLSRYAQVVTRFPVLKIR